MTKKEFYIDFDFTEVQNLNKENLAPELEEISYLGVDKVYFSGDYPAILFKEVNYFDNNALKDIARFSISAGIIEKLYFYLFCPKQKLEFITVQKDRSIMRIQVLNYLMN